ncbi:MAG: metal ABC transporter substrate-binding protein [Spirochaetes bacterium]|jgi:zinc/manganese transport system substrate-binding protein|nr:metal ABC transporter substrate-binding protein [Spirochaetota bacterium]
MKFLLSIMFILLIPAAIQARVQIVVTYPYMADIAKIVGADRVDVTSIASGRSHPHYVNVNAAAAHALKKADLLVVNGAGLEEAWIEGLMKSSARPSIQPGTDGYLDLSEIVTLLREDETAMQRTPQFTHQGVNPHHHLDPANIPVFADAIAARLRKLDDANASVYLANARAFNEQWKGKMKHWDSLLLDKKGATVVQRHALFDYYLRHYDILCAGSLEPAPGVSPTLQHANRILSETPPDRITFIIRDVFNTATAATHLGSRTGIKVIVLPHDVGSLPEAADIFSLFDEIARRLAE